MIEKILRPTNLQRALREVMAHKGSAGVDGMKTSQLTMFFRKHQTLIMQEIRSHRYLPQPIMGVEIPKGKGKTRLLGIPTAMDRLLQQAVCPNMLRFDSEYSVNSYGFRPNKNAHQAVSKALEYIHDGLTYIVDIDLTNFFDEVDHNLLLNLIYQKVKCQTTMRLNRKWLRAPILIKGKLIKRRKGVPQGSPSSGRPIPACTELCRRVRGY